MLPGRIPGPTGGSSWPPSLVRVSFLRPCSADSAGPSAQWVMNGPPFITINHQAEPITCQIRDEEVSVRMTECSGCSYTWGLLLSGKSVSGSDGTRTQASWTARNVEILRILVGFGRRKPDSGQGNRLPDGAFISRTLDPKTRKKRQQTRRRVTARRLQLVPVTEPQTSKVLLKQN